MFAHGNALSIVWSPRLLPGQPLDKITAILHKLPEDDKQAILIRAATELLEVRRASFLHTKACLLRNSYSGTGQPHFVISPASQLLAASHATGIAHGDLKPANIFLDLQTCQQMTHVLDWGLAKQYQPGVTIFYIRLGLAALIKANPSFPQRKQVVCLYHVLNLQVKSRCCCKARWSILLPK